MKIQNLYPLFFLILLSFASCKKDSLTTEVSPIVPQPQPTTNIETILTGFITDRDGEAIADAEVSILNSMTQTDEFGFFEITGLVNDRFGIIKVEKLGYFSQFKTLTPSKNATSRTRIQLTEKGFPETLQANTGGEISVGQNSSVQFQPNSFVDEQGNTYNGTVSIYSFYIDPTDEDIDQFMPGNLMARNTQNQERILESYGMVNVELEGDGGQKLNINQPATLTVDIPNSISNNAPTEIPLWYFDEEKGLWIEEGNAVLQNGKYVGTVNHFTFWNCDVPSESTLIRGQVIDDRGVSILTIRVTNLSTGASFTTLTNSEGGFEFFVPRNVNLLLEVLGVCGTNVLFSENIGPYSEEEAEVGLLNVSSNTNFSLITGTLVACDQIPIANGSVFFNIPAYSFSQQATTNAAGEFSALIATCDLSEIEIRGVDAANDLVSDTETFAVSPEIDAGLIEVCTSVAPTLGSVTITIDGVEKVFDNCTVSVQDPGNGTASYLFTYVESFGTMEGDTITYYLPIQDLNNDLSNPNWSSSVFFFWNPPSNADMLNYTQYTVRVESNSVITVNQAASNPGELLQITIDNCKINTRDYTAGAAGVLSSHPNSSISLTGVFQ